MKVCQLCAVDFTLETFLLPLIDAMAEEGFSVTAVCSDGAAISALNEQGYSIKTVSISRSLNPIKHIASIWNLYCLFRKEKFDLVHVHTPVAALLGRIAAYLARVPFIVYTAHGFYFHEDMPSVKRRIHVALERFAGRFTSLLFTQSAEDASVAVVENIMPKDKVFTIGNGVDIDRFRQIADDVRPSLGIPEEAYVVGMVGRLVAEKGVVEFLEAAMLLAQQKTSVYFLLVGARLRSDHATAVDDAINDAIGVLGDRLIMTGLRQDIPELLSAMDLFCLPSWREGMPRTIIEAMMMGKPVVATNIRGCREEVVHGKTGLLVPVKSPELLASAIGQCFGDQQWAKVLGRNGCERALELYDERKVVKLQIELISHFSGWDGVG